MALDEKVINYKFVVLIEIYNFDFGCFTIQNRLINLNFKTSKLQPDFWDLIYLLSALTGPQCLIYVYLPRFLYVHSLH